MFERNCAALRGFRLGFGSVRVTSILLLSVLLDISHVAWSQPSPGGAGRQNPSAIPAPNPTEMIQSQLSADYDYVDAGPLPPKTGLSKPTSAVDKVAATPSPIDDGIFYPLYGDSFSQVGGATDTRATPQIPPPKYAQPPVSDMIGLAWGDRNEKLRERVKKLRKYGGGQMQLEALQRQYPGVDVKQMYDNYGLYGEEGLKGYLKMKGYGEGYSGSYRRGYGGGYGRGYGEDYGEDYGEAGENGYYYNGTWHPGYEREMDEGFYFNGMGDMEDWYYHNGTWYPTFGDWEDGYFHNGTWYPGLGEMDDWYYHNGTWYPTLGDWEDGYFHNGTWYPGLEDMMEGGYYYNGTWYPGYEREDYYEREGPEQEDLMWWQLHHPRWSGINDVGNKYIPPGVQPPPYVQVPPLASSTGGAPQELPPPPYVQVPPLASSTGGAPQQLPPPPYLHRQPRPQGLPPPFNQPPNTDFVNPTTIQQGRGLVRSENQRPAPWMQTPPQQQRSRFSPPPQFQARSQRPWPRRPQALPMTQPQTSGTSPRQRQASAKQNQTPTQPRRRPPPPGYVPRQMRGGPRELGRPQSARMTGRRGPPPPPRVAPPHAASEPKPSHVSHNPGPLSSVQVRPSSPLDPYRSTATVTVGIIIACLIGVALILAPLLCLLYKYRQEKRIKKRTFLRRADHGSIDDNIMDAMVMSELGERKGSRVAKLGTRGGNTVWKGGRKKGSGAATSAALARAKAELQPLETIAVDKNDEAVYSVIT
ncbi:hypothetical protein PoB_001450700 [Plakobranchus ocellatus]|uniref:Uncharacterized protein n=1 Tax=Plakobranchus ocellatus TaxID=259542 RepID=A0AAV3Z0E5_9GAST|nr:hypothetical protein PoB_001450700 [Plakobranchus ocellatus]